MLTKEILKANSVLSGLSEEQLTAIATLSQNDENAVIAKKTGEIYGALDADILEVSGMEKVGVEKTYEYAKRVLGELKSRSDGSSALQAKADALEKEKARLEKAIADGAGDKEAAKALKQAKADLANVTAQYAELNDRYEQAKAAHEKELTGVKVDGALSAASSSLKFKSGFPESVVKVVLRQAMDKIKGMKPEYIDDGKGGKLLAFKGEDGAIMRNPENQLNPYSASELLAKELDAMGVLDKGRTVAGTGTQPPAKGSRGEGSPEIDVSGAKTKVEAYEAISRSLMARGLTAGSKAFDEAMSQAWKDNDVASLPEK